MKPTTSQTRSPQDVADIREAIETLYDVKEYLEQRCADKLADRCHDAIDRLRAMLLGEG